jgi:excisionase family DNA binding protein
VPTYLTVDEAAALLRVNPATIRRRIEDGRLPVVRLGRRLVRIPADAIAATLEQP